MRVSCCLQDLKFIICDMTSDLIRPKLPKIISLFPHITYCITSPMTLSWVRAKEVNECTLQVLSHPMC